MECPNCNNEISKESKTCDICGFNLTTEPIKLSTPVNKEEQKPTKPSTSVKKPVAKPIEPSPPDKQSIKRVAEKPKIKTKPIKEEKSKIGAFGKENPQLFLALLLFGITILIIIIFTIVMPFIKNLNAEKMHVIATNLFIRSTPFTGTQSNILGKAPFGTSVNVYERKNGWAEVEAFDISGYMSLDYLISEKQYIELNSIYGNRDARELITLTSNKRALLKYFKNNNIIGYMHIDFQKEFYGNTYKSVWQIYGLSENSEYNSVCWGHYSGNEKKDFACVITKKLTDERKVLIFQIISDNESKLLAEVNLTNGEYIKTVKKSERFYQGRNWRQKLKSDAILCKDINPYTDKKQKLLVFDENTFKIFEQQN